MWGAWAHPLRTLRTPPTARPACPPGSRRHRLCQTAGPCSCRPRGTGRRKHLPLVGTSLTARLSLFPGTEARGPSRENTSLTYGKADHWTQESLAFPEYFLTLGTTVWSFVPQKPAWLNQAVTASMSPWRTTGVSTWPRGWSSFLWTPKHAGRSRPCDCGWWLAPRTARPLLPRCKPLL